MSWQDDPDYQPNLVQHAADCDYWKCVGECMPDAEKCPDTPDLFEESE